MHVATVARFRRRDEEDSVLCIASGCFQVKSFMLPALHDTGTCSVALTLLTSVGVVTTAMYGMAIDTRCAWFCQMALVCAHQ